MKKSNDKQRLINILTPVLIVAIAMAILIVILVLSGNNPFEVFRVLVVGAVGTPKSIINILIKMVPICLSALAVGLAKRAGVFNIGVEGQLIFGALGSTIAGIYFKGLPAVVHIPLCILCGMLCGMLFALLPTVMYLKKTVNLLVVFILMNSIVKKLTTYFVIAVIGDPTAYTTSSLPIQDSAWLPNLITKPGKLNIGIVIMLLMCALFYYMFYKTTTGFNLNAVGFNREASIYSGLDAKKYIFSALVIGGAIAGLAGSIEVLGTYHRLYDGFSPGYGFDGIPIALLANGNLIGIIAGSFLFAALRVGSLTLQLETGISSEIVSVIQGTLIVLIACEYILKFLANKIVNRKKEASV